MPRFSVSNYGGLDRLAHIEQFLSDQGSQFFVVTDSEFAGGAKGDGTTDDTAAIQLAINAAVAAQGSVIFPPAASTYRITNTLNIIPPAGASQAYCNLWGQPGVEATIGLIFYDGPSNQPAIATRGWRLSSAWNINVRVPTGKTGVTVWDIDNTGIIGDPTFGLPPYTISSTQVDFHNCSVFFASGSTSSFGWRMGASNRNTDISVMSWHDCSAFNGGAATANHTGWSIEMVNAIGFQWFGGIGGYLNPMIKCTLGEAITTFGLHGTHNDADFQIASVTTPVLIYGGRFELGKRFLDITHNTASPQPILLSGTRLYKYAPADGIIFRALGIPNIELDNVMVINPGGADYTNQLLWMYSDSAGTGTAQVRGGMIQAPYPFHTIFAGSTAKFDVDCRSVARLNNAQVQTAINGRNQANALAYSATIATDANLSEYFTINVTNGTAFTISNPTNPLPGREITYDIKNSSGGAMGVVTWGAAFKIAAFTNPGNGLRTTLTVKYDGTNWVQVGPQGPAV